MTPSETTETRLRRLHMRSWRRGMKEMDLILGAFADELLSGLHVDELDSYEQLLHENDQDLYLWVTSRIARSDTPGGPAELGSILDRVAAHAAVRFQTADQGAQDAD